LLQYRINAILSHEIFTIPSIVKSSSSFRINFPQNLFEKASGTVCLNPDFLDSFFMIISFQTIYFYIKLLCSKVANFNQILYCRKTIVAVIFNLVGSLFILNEQPHKSFLLFYLFLCRIDLLIMDWMFHLVDYVFFHTV
jgi:hypothetical protein